MQLYIVPGSPNCRKVEIVVHELGLDLDVRVIDFRKGDHQAPADLKINPNGRVPALVDGDLQLWESTAIMQYLADSRGGDPLFPREPKRRADVVRWMSWELAHFGAELGDALFERLFKPYFGGQADEDRVRRAVQ